MGDLRKSFCKLGAEDRISKLVNDDPVCIWNHPLPVYAANVCAEFDIGGQSHQIWVSRTTFSYYHSVFRGTRVWGNWCTWLENAKAGQFKVKKQDLPPVTLEIQARLPKLVPKPNGVSLLCPRPPRRQPTPFLIAPLTSGHNL